MTAARNDTWAAEAMRTSSRGALWTIVLFGISLKAVLLFGLVPFFTANSPRDYMASHFPDYYDYIAWNLVQGNGYRVFEDTSLTMLRPPGFVLLLAGVFAIVGKSLFAVQLLHLVFSIVAAALTHMLTKRAGFSTTTAWVAAAIFFFHPGVVVGESRGGPESMLTLCLISSVFLSPIAIERQKWHSFASAGLVNGLALLVKSSVAPVLPALLLYGL